MKNKKGQAQILFIFMVGIVLFFLGLGLAPAINDTINNARGQSFEGYSYDSVDGMWVINDSTPIDCSNESISNQGKAVCTSLDAIKPFWLGCIFGLAGMVIVGVAIRG